MTNRVFDFDMVNGKTIITREGERLYKIITDNPCDDLYIISTPADVDDDARLGMLQKFGKRGPAMVQRLEDVSALLEAE